MSSTSSRPPERDPLQNLLKDAEDELRRRLQDACEAEAKGLSTESTEEIRRLEDNLLGAAMAAKQTVAVRRHMKRRRSEERERPIKIDVAADRDVRPDASGKGKVESGVGAESTDMGVREFIDEEGRPWRAWPVIPGLSRASSSGRQFLGDFQNGWICFEGLDTSARRRLPSPQASWANISDQELQRLLEQAIDAPIRNTKRQDKR
ncbi:MAG TPA: hypothetical protein VJV97_02065 [Gemmatimonadaceae bacterium]|nr:hypothetical protein [Gemmatimonadaceae bacterium]